MAKPNFYLLDHTIDVDINLIGAVVLLKSMSLAYEKTMPYRHRIGRVVDQDIEYVSIRPFLSIRSIILARYSRTAIEGILSEEYAEQLLMMEILKNEN